jgi:SAM-dependent methyltransferase
VPEGDDVQGTLERTFSRVLEAKLDGYDPWLYQYCGALTDTTATATYLRHTRDLLAFGGIEPRGARILDAGSGFGFTLIILAALGAAEACGVEVYEPMVETVRAYRPLLPTEFDAGIDLRQCTVTDMPYADDSFDAMLSIEAISHYRDVPGFISEAHRVLKPGGVLVISDGNNSLNPLTRRKTLELWDAFETGSVRGPLHGHTVHHCYVDERREFVETNYPHVPADRMAQETFGMTYAEVADACERYVAEGVFPGSVYDRSTVPLNPGDGTVIERLFNPNELARMFRRAGFAARVRGYWGGASGRRHLRVANALLSRLTPVTIYTARGFLIAARKNGGA